MNTTIRYSLLAAAIALAGCASKQPAPVEIVRVEKPKPQIIVPADPYQGLVPDVVAAIKHKQTPTLEEGIATFFPYGPNQQWNIYCWPLNPTEIRLNPDEYTDKDSVVIGDSVRWGIKISTQAVMVEPLGTPADPNMKTSLIIHTNRRSYHLNLQLRRHYTSAVQWYYASDVLEQDAVRQLALKQVAAEQAATDQQQQTTVQPSATIADPASAGSQTTQVIPQVVQTKEASAQ